MADHLYEFVSVLQAVPQPPSLGLPVVFVVLPEPLSLLLLLLLLPQLLPRVFELSGQRRNHAVVSLLLLLAATAKGTSKASVDLNIQMLKSHNKKLPPHSGRWNLTDSKSNRRTHLHNFLVFLQRRGEFSDLLTQGGAVFLSSALSRPMPTGGVSWSLEGRKKQAVTESFPPLSQQPVFTGEPQRGQRNRPR